MNPRLMRLMRLHRLMDAADGGDGTGGSAGGSASGDATGGAESATKPDATGATGDKSDAASDKGSKPSDAEAKLLREVMEKKTKLKETETALSEVKQKLAQFDGIDPEAVKALLNEKKLAEQRDLEAKGNWDALKKQMNDAHQAELTAREALLNQTKEQNSTLQAQIAELTVGNAFGQSKFIHEEIVLTPSKTRQVYGSHFEFDGEQVVAYDKPAGAKARTMLVDGKGDPLGFEAAMRKLIEIDPDRDQLLKSKAKAGAGSRTESRSPTPPASKDISSKDKIAAGLKAFNAKK